jgi:hypothetical protein
MHPGPRWRPPVTAAPPLPAPPGEIRTVSGNPIRTPAERIAATPPGVLHFADQLNAPGLPPAADGLLLISLLDLYRGLTHGTDPVGDNEEITAVLTGENRLGYAFINPKSPAVNAQGQLCDRWGTPYFFHQISGTQMQIRSGGPDRKLWTKDDIVVGP